MNVFNVGDKVIVENFFGKVLRETEVTEITPAGNIRTKAYKGLFNPDGTERKRGSLWTDRIYIKKYENEEG